MREAHDRQGPIDLEAGPTASSSARPSTPLPQSQKQQPQTSAAATSASVHFRELRIEDISELKELQRALFPVHYNDSFYQRLFTEGHFTLVGVTPSEEIVAVASARIMEPLAADMQREAYIMTLGVKETHRRQGLGRRSMDHIIRVLRAHAACEIASLHVKTENAAAVSFYQGYGFSIDPDNGFCRDHYLIHGKQYHAYRFTFSLRRTWTDMLGCSLL